jgi:hypothetical protein
LAGFPLGFIPAKAGGGNNGLGIYVKKCEIHYTNGVKKYGVNAFGENFLTGFIGTMNYDQRTKSYQAIW